MSSTICLLVLRILQANCLHNLPASCAPSACTNCQHHAHQLPAKQPTHQPTQLPTHAAHDLSTCAAPCLRAALRKFVVRCVALLPCPLRMSPLRAALPCCHVLAANSNPRHMSSDLVLLHMCASHAPLACLGMVQNTKTMSWPMPTCKGLTPTTNNHLQNHEK
ncbi:hypothetical protein GBA52_003813 [Prunus armeniaca]|nr:hypothetical protein GBA52_003813 [Prunus armeniaca]